MQEDATRSGSSYKGILVGENSSDQVWKREVSKGTPGARYIARPRATHTSVVDLARAGVHSLEQLVDLLLSHLLAQVGQDVLELADANKARHVFIKHLEAAAVFFGLAGIAEAAWSVQDALEGIEVNCKGESSKLA